MHLVERHVIKRADQRVATFDPATFDPATFASRHLCNAATLMVWQPFTHQGVYLDSHKLHQRM